MATTTIPWNDGSGDNIYLSASSQVGDQTVTVTSDQNTGSARTKTVTFTAGNVTQQLTINQAAGAVESTLIVYPSSYDQANSVYQSIQASYPATNAYTDADSSTYSSAKWKNGSEVETKFYWKFDLSQIPVGATIKSVSVIAKVRLSTTDYQTGESYLVVCNGTTEKGQRIVANTTSAKKFTLDAGVGWTRDDIQNISILFHTQRGTSNTSGNYYQRFYGATLTIKYIA